ncbi:gp53-like domain-containing protein [Escherichia coli]|uniref:gp53-like domain-containing protein n=1 Tax=Escherichia coli TaxID=562 RepID=UPI003D363B0D
MHRIDTKTAQKDKFGAGKNGFTRGNPQTGTPATDLDDDYFDMLQEELCSVVEASGASLEKARHDQLLTALRALLLSRKNPFGDIKSDGTVKTALENLGLGEAAKRDVGTGNDQIPDMSSFSASDTASSGWYILPNGHIHQYGIVTLAEVSTYNKQTLGGVDYYTRFYTVTLPRAYPTAHISTTVTLAGRTFDKQGPEFGYWVNCNRTVNSAEGVSTTQFVVEVISKDTTYVPVIHFTSEGY